MKLIVRLFVFMGLSVMVIGFYQKFFGTVILFPDISPLAHLVCANTFFLIALILKIAND